MRQDAGGQTLTDTVSHRIGDAERPHSLALWLLLVLALSHFMAVVARVLPSVIAADLQAAFDLDDGQFGLLHGPAFVTVYAVGLVASTTIVNRVNRYRLMAACMLVWTLASLACAMAVSFEQLVVARVFVGLGQAAFAPAAISLIAGTGSKAFARPLSVFSSGAALGRSGTLLLGGAVLAALVAVDGGMGSIDDWRVVYVALSVPGLLLALVLVTRRDLGRDDQVKGPGLIATVTWIWQRTAAFAPHMVASCAAILLTQGASAWIPSVFSRTLSMPPADAALLAGTVILLAAPAGHLTGGYLSDRLTRAGRSPTLILIGGLFLCCVFGVMLGLARSPVVAVAAYAGLSICLGAAALSALAGVQCLTPADRRGSVTALYLATVSLVGLGLGPPLIGVISHRGFTTSAGLGQALALVVVVVAVIGATAALIGLSAWHRQARDVAND